MTPPTNIDGSDITGATIDGQEVQEITVDGQTVFTASVGGVIDDFEDNNLNEYSNVSGGWSTVNGLDGIGLGINGTVSTGPGGGIYSEPGDGLNTYFAKGQRVSMIIQDPTADNFAEFLFGWDGDNINGYNARPMVDFSIARVDAGNRNRLVTLEPGVDSFQRYLELDWHDGSGSKPDNTIHMKTFNVGSNFSKGSLLREVEATDATYANQAGIGFAVASNSQQNAVMWDNVINRGNVP